MTTTKFEMLTQQVARSLDAADTRMLVVPHPLGGTDTATITDWADAAVDEALRLLTGAVVDASPAPPDGDLDHAFATVRALVAADGGDLVLEAFDGSTAELRLVLDTAACRECVMPREFLERVALDKMSAAVPGLSTVTIVDPREDATPR